MTAATEAAPRTLNLPLADVDPEIAGVLARELERQQTTKPDHDAEALRARVGALAARRPLYGGLS